MMSYQLQPLCYYLANDESEKPWITQFLGFEGDSCMFDDIYQMNNEHFDHNYKISRDKIDSDFVGDFIVVEQVSQESHPEYWL